MRRLALALLVPKLVFGDLTVLPSLTVVVASSEVNMNWVPGGSDSERSAIASRLTELIGLPETASTSVREEMTRIEEEWWRSLEPDYGGIAPCAEWPDSWRIEDDSAAIVDRRRGIALDWSPRAGSSAAIAAFYVAMGYDSSSRVLHQARKICRQLRFLRASPTGLCPESDDANGWVKFDFFQRGSHNAHYLRMLLESSFPSARLQSCERIKIVKVVRNPYDRAVSCYRFAMIYDYLVPSKGHTGPGLADDGKNASFSDFLRTLLVVHRRRFRVIYSGLYAENGWSAHHRPQKRLFEYQRAVDTVIKCEEISKATPSSGQNHNSHLRNWIDAIYNDNTPTMGDNEAAPLLSDEAALNAVRRTSSTSAAGDLGWLDLQTRFGDAMPDSYAFYYKSPFTVEAVSELYDEDFATYSYDRQPPSRPLE